jgi:hypothetical protein
MDDDPAADNLNRSGHRSGATVVDHTRTPRDLTSSPDVARTLAPDHDAHDGVEANARLTGETGAVLFVLFALEGATILLGVRSQLPAHVFIGLLVLPPVVLKLATTSYRMIRYYRGDPRFVRRGPPPMLLRLMGPVVGVTTVALIASGVADVVAGPSRQLGMLHKASFIVWFGAMTVHVLGHLAETPQLATADWRRRSRNIPGSIERGGVVLLTVAVGLLLGWWSLGWIGAAWTRSAG